jgi:hypothetical protein
MRYDALLLNNHLFHYASNSFFSYVIMLRFLIYSIRELKYRQLTLTMFKLFSLINS